MFARFNVDVSNTKTVFSSVKSKCSSFSSQMADTGHRLMERFRYTTRLQFITNLAQKWRLMSFSGWPNIIQINVDKVELVLSHPCHAVGLWWQAAADWLLTELIIWYSGYLELKLSTILRQTVLCLPPPADMQLHQHSVPPSLTEVVFIHSTEQLQEACQRSEELCCNNNC